MKVVIIGSSGHYNYAIEGIKEDRGVIIVGVAPGSEGEDISPAYRAACKIGHVPKIYDDYRTMLDEVKPDIAVVNCFFGHHARVTMQVLERGIHAFVEKPLATTFEDLEQLKEVHSRSGVHLAAMFGIRYSAHFITAWNLVKEGVVGEIRLMNAQKSYKLGQRSEFYKSRSTYGGTIPWVGSHAIDWLYWFGGQKFESVFASHSARYNREHGELEVSALCHFTFSNEVFGSVSIDYLRPKQAPTHDDDRLRVVGTRGVLEVRDGKVYLINDEIDGIREVPLMPKQNIFIDFLRQIKGEGQCLVTAHDSFYVTEACLKARQSADEGKVIRF
ncbi:putative dehydrogenase [Caldicoprobacter guelmensis]|uniref:Gfo/Idh/MocA family protein n=1 Tax=Caldicoprobacter guelmensis TaxID=1170224 RepID=UPI00195D5B84|nr:Gfo/Idh/MocA family oxidoreductase [Caldicoprobacter guelmensis]MBM7582242.1 putative dehydrogenase [Caldicoprobacter guelmensis]